NDVILEYGPFVILTLTCAADGPGVTDPRGCIHRTSHDGRLESLKSARFGIQLDRGLRLSELLSQAISQARAPFELAKAVATAKKTAFEEHTRELTSSLAATASLVEIVSFGTEPTSEKAGRSARIGLMVDQQNQCFCRLWIRLARGGAFSASIQSPAQISVSR